MGRHFVRWQALTSATFGPLRWERMNVTWRPGMRQPWQGASFFGATAGFGWRRKEGIGRCTSLEMFLILGQQVDGPS